MGCDAARGVMQAALDHEVGPALRNELAEHLARCPSCASEWKRLTAVEAMLQGARPVDPPARLGAAVTAGLAPRSARSATEPDGVSRGEAVALAAVAVVGASLWSVAPLFGLGAALADALRIAATAAQALLGAMPAPSLALATGLQFILAFFLAAAWFAVLLAPRRLAPRPVTLGER